MEKKFILGDIVVMIADGPKMAVEGYVVEDDGKGGFIESDEYVNGCITPPTVLNAIPFTRTC